ncbi:MAG: RHS repeat protein, partial [Opitutaceae bacterium]|nr:RHS repeat protein [Opitutaceae bacterium]
MYASTHFGPRWTRAIPFGLSLIAGGMVVPESRAINPGETVSLGSASGGAAESQRTFPFPAASGTLVISYQMYDVPDSLSVSADGVQLVSTVGRVQGSSVLRVPISGATSALVIVNAGSGLPGTAWDYSVSFTVAPVVPDISGSDGEVAGQSLDLGKPGMGMWGDPVHTATGAHVIDWAAICVQGARELSLRVGYNSLYSSFGLLGRGWHHSYEAKLSLLPGGGIYYRPHSAELHTFQALGGGTYSCADLAHRRSTLTRGADGTYTLTDADQTRLVFDAAGTLLRQIDAQGREVVVSRIGGQIDRVTEPVSGVYLSFEYNSQGFVSRVADSTGRGVRFTYDAGLEGKLVGLSLPHTGSGSSAPSWQFTYTNFSQLQKATDPDGRVSFINYYDAKGRVASQDDGRADTVPTQFVYDEESFPGRLTTTVIDRNQSTIRYTYDSEYRMVSMMDQNGVQTISTYDPITSELAMTEAPLSRLTRFQHDAQGNLTRVTAADGSITSYTYDSRNNLATLTDAAGQTARYTFDGYNRPSQILLPDGAAVGVRSGTGALIEAFFAPGGGQTSFTYSLGRLTRATDPTGVVTSYGYDPQGRVVSITNALGNTMSFAYDPNDNVTTVTSPLRRVGTRSYSARREVLSSTDPSGATTRYAYDGDGNLVEETDPLGFKSRMEYDPEDRLIAFSDPAGGRTSRTLDRAGRTTAVTDALGNTIRFTYDTIGNLTRIADALGQNVVQFTYDLKNRPITEVDALGRTTAHQFDALDRQTRSTDPLGRVVQYTFDSRSRLTAVTNGLGQTVRQLFDSDNRVVAVTDARGNLVDYDYDAAGRTTAIGTAEGSTWRMTYDAGGQLLSVTRPSGVVTTLTYDADGRISRTSDTTGATDVVYDAAGRISSFRTGIVTLASFTYDLAGHPLTYRENASTEVSYQWDPAGRLSRLTYPSGHSVDYAYDAAGQMITVTD